MAKLHAHLVPGGGPPAVFLHGVLRNGRCFTPLFSALAPRWSVHALDQRGHGQSERGSRYMVTDYVGDAAGYLREEVGRPAIVYGHSLGAMVAARLAALHPELVAGLVLEDPPFHTMGTRLPGTALHGYFLAIQPFVGRNAPVETLARELADLDVPTANGSTVKLSSLRDAPSIRFFASCLRQVDPAVIAPIAAGTWLDGYEAGRVECPVLLLRSDPEAGGMLTEEDAAGFALGSRDCTTVFLKGIGHQAHWMGTATLVRHVTEFLLSLE